MNNISCVYLAWTLFFYQASVESDIRVIPLVSMSNRCPIDVVKETHLELVLWSNNI